MTRNMVFEMWTSKQQQIFLSPVARWEERILISGALIPTMEAKTTWDSSKKNDAK